MRALRMLEKYDDAIRARVRSEVAGALGREASNEALIEAALRAHAAIDGAGPRTPALEPACAAGCSYCCHVHAYATTPELLANRRASPAALESGGAERAPGEARAASEPRLGPERRATLAGEDPLRAAGSRRALYDLRGAPPPLPSIPLLLRRALSRGLRGARRAFAGAQPAPRAGKGRRGGGL